LIETLLTNITGFARPGASGPLDLPGLRPCNPQARAGHRPVV